MHSSSSWGWDVVCDPLHIHTPDNILVRLKWMHTIIRMLRNGKTLQSISRCRIKRTIREKRNTKWQCTHCERTSKPNNYYKSAPCSVLSARINKRSEKSMRHAQLSMCHYRCRRLRRQHIAVLNIGTAHWQHLSSRPTGTHTRKPKSHVTALQNTRSSEALHASSVR